MKILGVKYLGLQLSSPVMVSSCGLTADVDSIKKIEKCGAGAVVLKSLFEEQIMGEITHNEQYSDYPESAEYLNAYIKENSISKYLDLIVKCKAECSIPIIASICCVHGGEWKEFAKDIEKAGADAIELNIFYVPVSGEQTAAELEKEYLITAAEVVGAVKIPVVVKLSSHFTNPINMARELYYRGVKGVVMFNRLYDPDIDIENMSIGVADIFSYKGELRNSLRWIAMSSSVQPEIDYSASTGVHSGEDVVKMLLAGAKTVQICSELYENGVEQIVKMNMFINKWMVGKGYMSINDFRGLLSYKNLNKNVAYERSQFMKYYSSRKN